MKQAFVCTAKLDSTGKVVGMDCSRKQSTNGRPPVRSDFGSRKFCECDPVIINVGDGKYQSIQCALNSFSDGNHTQRAIGEIHIPAGTYTESLYVRSLASSATDFEANGCGLELVGDTRELANMTYMAGGVVDMSGTNLGANEGRISLTNNGLNAIQVIVSGGNPNFPASSYGSGDVVLIRGNDGNWYERQITAVLSNEIQFGGLGVAVGDLGSSVVFCPNVIVSPDVDNSNILDLADAGLRIIGIWFKNTNPTTVNICRINHGRLAVNNCLFDGRVASTQYNVFADNNSVLDVSVSSTLGSSMTVIGCYAAVVINGSSYLTGSGGLTGANGATVRSFDSNSGVVLNDGSTISINYVQAMNCAFGFNAVIESNGRLTRIFTIIGSDVIGVMIQRGSNIRLPADTRYPRSIVDGLNLNSTQVGIQVDRHGRAILDGGYEIRGCAIGLFDVRGSAVFRGRFTILDFSGTIVDIATDAISQYGGELTRPPSNGSQFANTLTGQLQNQHLVQSLNNGSSQIDLSFDPSTQIGFTRHHIYREKTFTITDLTGGQNHTISLSGGAGFWGCGFYGDSTAIFDGYKGDNITFLVLDNDNVIVKASCGVNPSA